MNLPQLITQQLTRHERHTRAAHYADRAAWWTDKATEENITPDETRLRLTHALACAQTAQALTTT